MCASLATEESGAFSHVIKLHVGRDCSKIVALLYLLLVTVSHAQSEVQTGSIHSYFYPLHSLTPNKKYRFTAFLRCLRIAAVLVHAKIHPSTTLLPYVSRM